MSAVYCCTSIVRHYVRADDREDAELIHEELLQPLYRDLNHEQLVEFAIVREEDLDIDGYADILRIGEDDGE